MKYVRMYTDSNGDSHFENVTVDLKLGDYSPPTPPVYISNFTVDHKCRSAGFAGPVGKRTPRSDKSQIDRFVPLRELQ